MKKSTAFLIVLLLLFLITVNTLIIDAAYHTVSGFFQEITDRSLLINVTSSVITILLASLVVFTAVVIILERRDPAKTLAWLMILIFLPFLGFFLYLSFGRQFRKRRMTAKKRVLNNYIYPLDETLEQGSDFMSKITKDKEHLIQLSCNNADFPLTLGNETEVLTDGEQIFPSFMEAMKNAHEHIHLETYILRDDNIGNKIQQILLAKAQEGVKIRIIFDDLGSRSLGKKYIKEMRSAGIQIEPFFPVRIPFFHSKINYRNHRKILVVDGTTGFVGGVNIGDEYLGRDPKFGFWRDTHLRIKGNAVYFLQRIFLQDWYFVTGESLENKKIRLFPPDDRLGKKMVQITASGPDTHWESIMQVYYYAIATARKTIYLTSPYFIPNESILTALKTAALSGVDVKMLIPAKGDHRIVSLAAMSYLEELMEAGIEIYLYKKGFVHAKTLCVDGIFSTIGSANMDLRSFQLNFEVNALIYDKETTLRLEGDFQEDLRHSELMDPEKFKERPLTQKFLESGARLLSPLL